MQGWKQTESAWELQGRQGEEAKSRVSLSPKSSSVALQPPGEHLRRIDATPWVSADTLSFFPSFLPSSFAWPWALSTRGKGCVRKVRKDEEVLRLQPTSRSEASLLGQQGLLSQRGPTVTIFKNVIYRFPPSMFSLTLSLHEKNKTKQKKGGFIPSHTKHL